MAGPEWIVKACGKLQGQMTSGANSIAMRAALEALTGDQSCVEKMRAELQANRDNMVALIDSFDGVSCVPPDGTFYCLADFSAYEKDDVKLAEFLLEKALVVTVPGSEFGAPGHLRLTYCGQPEEINEALARIKWALGCDSVDEIKMGGRTVRRSWG